ncbi:hypothetical protein Kpho02_67660 [Kitasatospora phosalacinea]|uniref:Uncharacterized protein n=1 Tax=Kitasatospora phosalacinea TaxID=2065 RepID=A0A9W6QGM2_9ACTN|nr:hypothetical protein Kpho02_67660 [Kitasatospora phosalacinea]
MPTSPSGSAPSSASLQGDVDHTLPVRARTPPQGATRTGWASSVTPSALQPGASTLRQSPFVLKGFRQEDFLRVRIRIALGLPAVITGRSAAAGRSEARQAAGTSAPGRHVAPFGRLALDTAQVLREGPFSAGKCHAAIGCRPRPGEIRNA